uniref:SCP domain-containing protein n=1 Tax=Strongyloides papillosus TaxID=174720 RepID=A0A0N5BV73_STREA
MNFIKCLIFYTFFIVFETNADEVVFEVGRRSLRERNFLYFDNQSHADQHELLVHISKAHPELVDKEITIVIVGYYNNEKRFIRYSLPETFKACVPEPNKRKLSIPTRKTKNSVKGILVQYSIDGQPLYKCNGRTVPSLKQLAECALKQRRLQFGRTCSKGFYKDEPSVCVGQIRPKEKSLEELFCEKPSTTYMFNFQKSLHDESFSNRVWFHIWKNRFNYECYSRDNFYLLKIRFLLEINTYRVSHKSSLLFENAKMTEKAQRRAEEIAQIGKLISDPNKEYEEIIDCAEVLMVPFMVKKWYDEINKYKYRFPLSKGRNKNFVKLLWKVTRYVGIGVAKRFCHSHADQFELLQHISKAYPELVHKEVNILIVGCYYSKEKRYLRYNTPETYKACVPSLNQRRPSISRIKKTNTSKGILLRYSINGQPSYSCNGKRVPSLKHLAKCALKQRQLQFGPTCSRVFYEDEPPACTRQKRPKEKSLEELFCEKPNTVYIAEFKKCLYDGSFSSKVWFNIWKDRYSYECYSMSNFYLLRKRYLLEINTYRVSHRSSLLVENAKMTEKAQRRAEKIAIHGKPVPDPIKEYEEIIDCVEVFMVPFMIKRWYDEINKYNYRFPLSKGRNKNFVKLLWMKTRDVGIGIAKHSCDVCVVLKFTRRKNKFKGYRNNIKRRNLNQLSLFKNT